MTLMSFIRMMLAMVMIATVQLVFSQTGSAVTAPAWSVSTGTTKTDMLSIHSTGEVTARKCGMGIDPAEVESASTFSANGSTKIDTQDTYNAPGSESLYFCDDDFIVASSGLMVGVRYDPATASNAVRIEAYQNGSRLWTKLLKSSCNTYGSVVSMALGADGRGYAIVDHTACSTALYRLYSFNLSTGAMFYDKALGSTLNPGAGVNAGPYMRAFSSGVVIRSATSGFRYFNYAGTEQTAKNYTVSLGTNQFVDAWNVEPNGDLYVSVVNAFPACGLQNASVKFVQVYYSTHTAATNNTTSLCFRPVHSKQNLAIAPGGKTVITAWYSTGDILKLTTISENMATLTSTVIDTTPGTTSLSQAYSKFEVDANGNVLLSRQIAEDQNLYGNDTTNEFILMGLNGSVFARYTTESLIPVNNTADKVEVPNFNDSSANFALSNGYIYFVACHTSGYQSGCNSTNNFVLHKLAMPQLRYAYPSNVIEGVSTTALPAQRDLVVLGDSFSAGEGVPPFYAATDIPSGTSKNMCHRSKLSYGEVLHRDPSLDINLQSSKSCSGATSLTLVSGQDTNGNQLNAITASTDVVALTIGGNDVEFSAFAHQCVDSVCDAGSQEYWTTYNAVQGTVQSRLYSSNSQTPGVLQKISTKLTQVGSTADVYVLGYPQLAPPASEVHDFPACSWLNTESEHTAARDIVASLNTKIAAAVGSMGSKYHFVDPNAAGSPFIDHELCDGNSYFNGVDVVNQAFSLHPNAYGQEAYATLLKQNLP